MGKFKSILAVCLMSGALVAGSQAFAGPGTAAAAPAPGPSARPKLFIDPAMVAATARPKVSPLPILPGHLQAARLLVGPHDLHGYRIVNRKSGSVFFVYYDEAGRKAAEKHVPAIDKMLSDVARLALVDAGEVHWGAVSFTRGSAHAPAAAGSDIRWQVQVDAQGELTQEGEDHFYNTLPHEQVHAAQKSQQSVLPRWFAEGQASWIGLKITRLHRPGIAEAWRAKALTAAKAAGPMNLTEWAGVRVSGDAIRRQLSPEEQAEFARDRTRIPNRGFHFNAADTVSDETQTRARYGASLFLFEQLETQFGAAAVEKWIRAAWQNPVAPHWTVLAALAKQHLGHDITERLTALKVA